MPTAAGAAMPYYNQIPQMEQGYYNPYINYGLGAGKNLSGQYGEMASNPTEHLQQLMNQYEPSAAYQAQQKALGAAASNTAASGGYRGTPQEQQKQQELTNSLLSQDMQQWLNNVRGIESEGLGGEQDLYHTGFQGSSNLASDTANVYGTEGSLAFQGENEREQRKHDLLGGLMGVGGAALGSLFGPLGTAAGGAISKGIGSATGWW